VSDDGELTQVVVQGRANAVTLELLRLELRRLARQHGAELIDFKVERDEELDLLT
jgi:hypothetical protein